MAAGGAARRPRTGAGALGWGRTDSRGQAFPERRQAPGRAAKALPEGERPQPGPAEPAARRQQRGGPGTQRACSSRRAAGKRPSKRLKSEEPAPANPELEAEELGGGGESPAGLGEAPQPSDGDQRSEDPGDLSLIQQGEGESIAGLSEGTGQKQEDAAPEPGAVQGSSAPAEAGSEDPLQLCSEEERSCQSLLSEESSLGDTDVPRSLLELQSSALLNEDSNQPMPVARFFGDLQLLQDLPAAAPPSTLMSRREFRKLHIIAKEEEEEEEEEDVV
ncbi:UPF0688 protein C1orf174 homolog [Melanerpes formicivorus]|uniref:UPF0688 protein C1orf174 homolog n=1 Tax=Melanerpes formicivorus TaxID=211600 RepID=UPI00358FCFC2